METIIDEFTNLAQRAITSNLLLGFSENLRGQNAILLRNLKPGFPIWVSNRRLDHTTEPRTRHILTNLRVEYKFFS